MSHSLALAGARANLVFHDISATAESRYAVPLHFLLATAEQLRLAGISPNVRIYIDDGYLSARPAAELLRLRYPEIEVVAAVTVTAIGKPGYLDWTDLETMRSWDVHIAGHGYQHLRLAGYVDGDALDTPLAGCYQEAPGLTESEELTANEVLFQLVETRDALHRLDCNEFVLPYGAYNSDVVMVNDRHRLFSTLSTADYGWDVGQQLRPRLLMRSDLSPWEVPALLDSPCMDRRPD